jgi:hypothetical protein
MKLYENKMLNEERKLLPLYLMVFNLHIMLEPLEPVEEVDIIIHIFQTFLPEIPQLLLHQRLAKYYI